MRNSRRFFRNRKRENREFRSNLVWHRHRRWPVSAASITRLLTWIMLDFDWSTTPNRSKWKNGIHFPFVSRRNFISSRPSTRFVYDHVEYTSSRSFSSPRSSLIFVWLKVIRSFSINLRIECRLFNWRIIWLNCNRRERCFTRWSTVGLATRRRRFITFLVEMCRIISVCSSATNNRVGNSIWRIFSSGTTERSRQGWRSTIDWKVNSSEQVKDNENLELNVFSELWPFFNLSERRQRTKTDRDHSRRTDERMFSFLFRVWPVRPSRRENSPSLSLFLCSDIKWEENHLSVSLFVCDGSLE